MSFDFKGDPSISEEEKRVGGKLKLKIIRKYTLNKKNTNKTKSTKETLHKNK
jgi:hypothetical protein